MEIFLIRALQFIVAITILVFLHEGGHFLFSKLFGVRVNKFYVFFDYKFRIFSSYSNWWRKLRGKAPAKRQENDEYEYDGTEYGIGWIPLGGYCMFYGEDDTEEKEKDDERNLNNFPVWKRLVTILMGPVMNFVLALVVAVVVMLLPSMVVARIRPEVTLRYKL